MTNCFVLCNVVILCFLSKMSLTLGLATEKLFGFCWNISCSSPDLSFDHQKIWPVTSKTELGLKQSLAGDPQEQNLSWCPKQLILVQRLLGLIRGAEASKVYFFYSMLAVYKESGIYGKMILSLPVDNFHELINCSHLHNSKAQQFFGWKYCLTQKLIYTVCKVNV